MGRREKVSGVKKEKIYALRKKLDDFIEEDKKRRDRNVYILERFEKMRSTVALLKSINNNAVVENETNHLISRGNERVLRHGMLTYRDDSDDRNILKEISKKYILIPRIYSIKRYPDIDVKQSEDVDWRSKYNILDELKKKEREEPPERDTSEQFLQTDSRLCSNNFSSINNNKNIVPQLNDRYNISVPNESIASNTAVPDESINSFLNNNNDWTGDKKIVEISNEQNDCKSIFDRQHNIESISNVNKGSKCVKEQDDVSLEVSETKYSENQDNSINRLPEHEISKECYDANAYEDDKIQHEKEAHPNKEKNDDKNCEESPELLSKILPELEINEKNLANKTEQKEQFYSEKMSNKAESNQVHQEETPETYANENNYVNDQWNYYYQEQNLQQEQQKQEPYNNASQENQEMAENHNQNHEQEYGDSQENQSNNDYHTSNYENYEGGNNNYPAENQNYDYQNVKQNSEYISSNDHVISSEQSQEINENFNENDPNYAINENGIEYDQQQQIYDQHSYVEPGHDQQQPYIVDKELIPENSVSENAQENFEDNTNQEEMYGMQHDYISQNHEETEQQFDVTQYPSNQSDNGNLQHDYNNQNINEIYQDNKGVQEEYDYSAQGLEIQQNDQQSDENQAEFVNYDTSNDLNAQNEVQYFQEDYNQNIQGSYQEENLQAQDIQDNVQYNYTTQNNELQHTITDVNTTAVNHENYVES